MSVHEETSVYGLEQGCPVHGDEYMRECSVCGCEYCRHCHTGAGCPDCVAEQTVDELDDELERQPDFEDVRNLDAVLEKDEEAERLVEEDSETIPPEDLVDHSADDGDDEAR